ncbi:MAG: carbon-nitrogen hydrolase family protein [SAR324 cluster bacterium]|nr:carbon-nitrogen hydrolase family protein [SAR324 cluster bacterium]
MTEFSKANLRVGMVQMTSAANVAKNIEAVGTFFDQAEKENIDLICFPECTNLIQRDRSKAIHEISSGDQNPFIDYCRSRAVEGNFWIHTGSVAVRDEGNELFSNRTFLIDNHGEIVCQYDKIHLFDVDLGNGRVHRESRRYQPGHRAVLCKTDWGQWGMSICYDLRFPHLYRLYAKAGATILFIPSAFTVPTGEMHWEVLLRSRAIENGCYVIASAQCGHHEDGRVTYGHSMIVNPWGEVVADAGPDPGILFLNLDLNTVLENRQSIPSLNNEREFLSPI